jgi:hypothetical protein
MIANRHGAKMRRLRLPLLSLLPRTLLSLFGKPLVILRYPKHHLPGSGVTHLPRQNTRLFGSLPPRKCENALRDLQ